MKAFEAQSYYELLEVSVSATADEIRAAFQRLSRLYGDDQMSLYGLVEPQRARELRSRLDEALQVLVNDDLRAEYDKRIGLPPRDPGPPPAAQAQVGRVALNWVVPPQEGRDQKPMQVVSAGDVLARGTAAVAAPVLASTRTISSEVPVAPRPSVPAMPARLAEVLRPVEAPPAEEAPAPEPAASAPETPEVAAAPAEPSPPLAPAPAPPAATVAPPAPELPPRAQAPVLAEESALALAPARAGLEPTSAPASPAAATPDAATLRPPQPEVPDDAVFDGPLLRRVREARGLSLQTLAERTRIGLRHLENLEADRHQQLPATVYLRGMLMSVSRELGLDGLKVSRSYLERLGKDKG